MHANKLRNIVGQGCYYKEKKINKNEIFMK